MFMIRQIIFGLILLVTLGIFAYSMSRLMALFRLTKPFPISDFRRRIMVTLQVAIGQSRILRFRFTGAGSSYLPPVMTGRPLQGINISMIRSISLIRIIQK